MDRDNPHTYGLNLATAMTIAAFCGIAWANTMEMQARIWLTFKRYSGLYFWSILVSSWGCVIHSLAFIFLDFQIILQANALGVMIGVGWWAMVTGFALVLYSRLHLVVRNNRRVRWVLIMIVTNFCILHLPIMLLSQMAYSDVPDADRWLKAYNIYEKVQMTGFTVQETIISGLYLWEARRILRPGQVFQRKKTNVVMRHLIYVNAFVILLDVALLATEYAGLFNIQTVFKAAVYSLKLRFEFVVLNQLKDLIGSRSTSAFSIDGTIERGTHETPRSARHIQLDTVHSGSHPSQGATAEYSGPNLSTADRETDGVRRTTIIDVETESRRDGDETLPHPQDVHGDGKKGFTVKMRSRGRHTSPASSEEGFAVRGAHPS